MDFSQYQIHVFIKQQQQQNDINGVQYSPPTSSTSTFSILAITLIGMLTTSFLLVGYYLFVVKCCCNRPTLRRRFAFFRNFRQEHLDQHQHHHNPIAYYHPSSDNNINRSGLDEYVIQSIPVFHFKNRDCFLCEDTEDCAVCLNQFEEGEKLRILPKCSHAFHIDCIDTWLQTHSNCPLCRLVIQNPIFPHQFVAAIENPYQETNQNHHPPSPENCILNQGILSYHQASSVSQELVVVTEMIPMNSSNSSSTPPPPPKKMQSGSSFDFKFLGWKSSSTRKHCLSSMGDECIDVMRIRDEQFSVEPIRRSFSMDSSSARHLYLGIQEVLSKNPNFEEACTSESSGKSGRRSIFPFGHGRVLPRGRDAVLPI